MDTLSRATAPLDRLIGASAPQQTGIVHLGLGNFHRAHAAVHTARALAHTMGDWGIVGVANSSRRVTDPLAAQDNLYSVLELSPDGRRADLVDVHRRLLVASEQTSELVDVLADPAHRIITLTVTEPGYRRSAATGRLDRDDADVAADLADLASPRTPVGRVAAGLLRRFQQSQAPVTVLPCDNLLAAGTTVRGLVVEMLEAARVTDDFWGWFEGSVAFPNAMVDRIVPSTTAAARDTASELLGLRDEATVPAERFSMWVMEDHFAAGRPAWEHAGATFSDEVERYELVKLRMLNGPHSLIAYLGMLDGRPTIPASRDQEFIARCADAVIRNEYLPSIDLPSGFDPDAYIAQLFDRWRNHALGHRTTQVGSEGSAKLLERVPAPAVRMLDRGERPVQLALTVAAWIACVAPPQGFDPGPLAAEVFEPGRERLAELTSGAGSVRAHVEAVMPVFFPDSLASRREFTDLVVELLEAMVRDGVRAAAVIALDD